MLDLLTWRTAIPFGHLLLALALLVAIFGGLVLTASGLRARRRGRAACGAALTALSGIAGWVNIVADETLDVNPLLTRSAIVGEWRDGEASLLLIDDGGYRCVGGGACSSIAPAGRWERLGDFELALKPVATTSTAASAQIRRIVSYQGQLRMTEMPDMDAWDGRLTFRAARRSGDSAGRAAGTPP